jgi:hypothetical protein
MHGDAVPTAGGFIVECYSRSLPALPHCPAHSKPTVDKVLWEVGIGTTEDLAKESAAKDIVEKLQREGKL